MIIKQMLTVDSAPDDLSTMSNELEKCLRLINAATNEIHLKSAERYLTFFARKWNFNVPNKPNLIITSMYDKIFYKRSSWQVFDNECAAATTTTVK